MSDNGGQEVEVIKVTLKDGALSITFSPVNFALISHAIRMISLTHDNNIIEKQMKQEEGKIIQANDIVNRMRKPGY